MHGGIIGLVGVQLVGRRSGRPRRPLRKGGIASGVGAIGGRSWQLAPVRTRPIGVPRASVTRWRLVPALPRSVGFGPVADPLFFAGTLARRRRSPGPNRYCPPHAGVRAAPDAGAATCRGPASHAAGASSSCRGHSSSQPATSPRGCRSAARTGCRSGQRGRPPEDVRLWGKAGAAAEAGRLQPRDRREDAGEPCRPDAQTPRSCRSVRRSISKPVWIGDEPPSIIRSSPSSPLIRSFPRPPRRVSRPDPPNRASSLPPPKIISLPPLAWITTLLERFTVELQSRSSLSLRFPRFLRRSGIHFVGKCSS